MAKTPGKTKKTKRRRIPSGHGMETISQSKTMTALNDQEEDEPPC